jgi:myo-inositol 2-dehydrogenase/D-chiro-inositol 1-dehydrogenase
MCEMKNIKFGIVGIGNMGMTHLKNIHFRIEGAEVIAVCARTKSNIEKVQRELGIPYGYTEYDEMLQNDEIDAIVVATGASMHKEQVIKACKAKKHIFCEKPLAMTIEECKEVEKAVNENRDKMFTLGFMRRFDPSYREAKEKIQKGEIGRVIHFKGQSLDPAKVLDDHLEGVKKGIYVPWFIEMGSHDTDLARWFLQGEPVESFATGGAYVCKELEKYDDYDNGFSLTTFNNGTSASIYVGRTHTSSHIATEIVGTKGTLLISAVPRKNYLSQFTESGYLEVCQDSFTARWSDAFYNEMEDFIRCVHKGQKPETTVEDGTASLEFCLKLHNAYLKNRDRV